ncbi:MAG TPA: FxsA family protein [Actinomycetes bacterium]|nr:FxsA family protein [Actinomycetes bacterium]
MVPALAILFILVPLTELAVIIAVGKSIGVLATLLLLLAFSLFGAWLAKREGLAAWRRFQLAMVEGRMPTREVADGAMILLAGALLLTPGFLTDFVGLLLLVPTTRAVARRWVPALAKRRVARRGRVTVVGSGPDETTKVIWGKPELDERAHPERPVQ